jgi:phospholipase C
MSVSGLPAQATQHLMLGTRLFALLVNLGAPVTCAAQELPKHSGTATPIKHVIVIIGENRTFDHVFATYQPKRREAVSSGSNRTVP